MSGNPTPAPRRAWLLRLLTVLMLTLTGLTAMPSTADAQANDPSVRVELTSVTPTVLRIDGTLSISGRVTNTSDAPLSALTVHLWTARGPFTNLDALRLAIDSQPYDYYGAVPTIDPRGAVELTPDKPLQPGESRDFTVTASNEDGDDPLHLNSVGVGYLVGVQVRQTADWRVTTIGSARTLIGSLLPEVRADAATVVLLNAQPRLIGQPDDEPALFADEKLADELLGRLASLLDLAENDGVTTVIDPALFDEVIAMAQGYRVGETRIPGVYADVAKAWLARVRDIIDSGTAYRTLYGSPDVSAAFSSNVTAPLNDSAAALASTHELAQLPLAIIPASGTANPELIAYLKQASPAVVIVDTIDIAHSVQIIDDLPLIATDANLYAGGPLPAPMTSVPQRRGRLAAQQIISAEQGSTSIAVVDTPEEAELITLTQGWRHNVPLSDVVAKAKPTPASFVAATQAPAAPGAWIEELDAARAQLRLWGELTGNAETAAAIERTVFAKAWSTTFAGRGDALAWIERATRDQSGVLADGSVDIHTAPRWVLTADVNELPITVTNTYTEPVQVAVHFRSQNATRIAIADTDLFTVPAGESTTIRVTPKATANGTVMVTAQLSTAAGTPVGDPVAITVDANSAGRVGWLIIIGSGAVLLVATFLRVRQVRRTRDTEGDVVPVNAPSYSVQPGGPREFAEQQQAHLWEADSDHEREGLD